MNGDRRHQGGAAAHVELQPRVDELVREQRPIVVRELRLEPHRAGGRIDLVVDRQQRADRQATLLVAVVRLDRKRRAGREVFAQRRQAVLRDGEDDGDRLQLRDHDQAAGIAGVDDVAGIDQAQPEPRGERGGDAAVDELQLGAVDLRLVGLHRALVLANQGLLRVELLLGDGVVGH